MKTRCKPGDIAVIIYDEPSCLGNVGRLVKIHPALKLNRSYGLDCWLIEPLESSPWLISEDDGTTSLEPIGLEDRIEHPDAWMLPIKDEQVDNVKICRVIDACEEIDQPLLSPL